MFVLDTHDIADSKVVDTVRTVEQLGKDQYERFVTKRLQERTKPLIDTIQKNKLPLFSSPPETSLRRMSTNGDKQARRHIVCGMQNLVPH